MRKALLSAVAWTTSTAVVLAAPGVTTTNVNFRSGPGTHYASLRTLPADTAIDTDRKGHSALQSETVE